MMSDDRKSTPFEYWAFISYSRQDQAWARSLHRSLETYRVPLAVRPAPELGVPSTARVTPVFIDQEELAVSPDLGDRLRSMLDRSRWVILLASRASCESSYVDAEVRHLIRTGRANDLRIVVLEDDEQGGTPFPPSLSGQEPLWLDARSSARPNRRMVLGLVAGMLGISLDALWQRDRRRRRRWLATTLTAIVLLMMAFAAAMSHQRRVGDKYNPQQQTSAFRESISNEVLQTAHKYDPDFDDDQLNLEITPIDLNGDRLQDFFVLNRTPGFSGSGGYLIETYVAEDLGEYRMVLNLFATGLPRTRPNRTGGQSLEILAPMYWIQSDPVYAVYRREKEVYILSHFEFGNGSLIEYTDDPIIIEFLAPEVASQLQIAPNAKLISSTDDRAQEIPMELNPESTEIIGVEADENWYLVRVWKGEAGFIQRQYVRRK